MGRIFRKENTNHFENDCDTRRNDIAFVKADMNNAVWNFKVDRV